ESGARGDEALALRGGGGGGGGGGVGRRGRRGGRGGPPRPAPPGPARPPRSVLRRRPRARRRRVLGPPAGWRVLRVPENRSGLGRRRTRERVAVVADGGVPDPERTDWLCTGRRLRRRRGGVRALLLPARTP